MANSVTTDKRREKMVKAGAGDIALPTITHMVFGDGGTDVNGNPIAPTGSDTELKNELLRKAIDSHTYPVATTCRYSCRLLKADLVNQKINEMALVDSDGDMVAIKTFTDKNKDDDMEMIFEIDDEF